MKRFQLPPVFRASFWMGGALLSFTTMAVAGRELSVHLNTFQILFFRGCIGLGLIGGLLWHFGWKQTHTQHWKLHLVRNLTHFVGQFSWFYALAFLPLAELFALEFTTPIWTAVLATFLLKEKITPVRLGAIGLGVLGMLIVLRPGLAVIHPASLVMLAGAVGFAFSFIFTKRLSPTESPLCIVFYMTVMQLPLSFFPSLHQWVTPPLTLLPWLLLVGTMALTAHYSIARALALSDTIVVVPLDFLRLPLIAIVGFLLYQEALEWPVLVGGAIMFSGNFFSILAERKQSQLCGD